MRWPVAAVVATAIVLVPGCASSRPRHSLILRERVQQMREESSVVQAFYDAGHSCGFIIRRGKETRVQKVTIFSASPDGQVLQHSSTELPEHDGVFGCPTAIIGD